MTPPRAQNEEEGTRPSGLLTRLEKSQARSQSSSAAVKEQTGTRGEMQGHPLCEGVGQGITNCREKRDRQINRKGRKAV